MPIHVDAASGGFVAPFLQPDLPWDFRVPRVASINSSGHKYGLVYPGVGWVIWRDAEALPEDLVFKVNYLGGEMPTFALNFSRSGAQRGRAVLQLPAARPRRLPAGAAGLPGRGHVPGRADGGMGPFELLSDGTDLPVFAFRLSDPRPRATRSSTCPSGCANAAGWCRPTRSRRTCRTGGAADRGAQRVRADLADALVSDMRTQVKALACMPGPPTPLCPAGRSGSRTEPRPAPSGGRQRVRHPCGAGPGLGQDRGAVGVVRRSFT